MDPDIGEFELIERYFTFSENTSRPYVGDDCAYLDFGTRTLAVTGDTLVAGVHFFADDDPADIAFKALGVNLSDLAVCGAKPSGFVLQISLNAVSKDWLESFSSALKTLSIRYACPLIGGDTVALPEGAPLSISITAFGEPLARVTRAGAVSGDDIWVTGYLGLAGAALTLKKAGKAIPDALLERLIRPEARLVLGQKIADRVSAACDVSDGFISDLNHILLASGVGARLDFASFPVHRELQNQEGELGTFGIERAILAGGDDYELVFCATPQYREAFKALSTAAIPVTRVGVVTCEPGLEILHLSAETQNALDSLKGYEHRVSLHV